MILKDFLDTQKNKRYNVFGLYTTPTGDFLFDNYSNYLDDFIRKYGNCLVVGYHEEEIDVFGDGIYTKELQIHIDNKHM